MIVTTRDQGAQRRRNRIYGTSEPPGARLSSASLLSNMTSMSGSSVGSASTVTQDLYAKPRQSTEKKRRSRRIDDGRKVQSTTADSTIAEAKNIDVFEFLVEMKESPPLPEKNQNESPQEKAQPENEPLPSQENDVERYYKTQLSDSGIFVSSAENDLPPDSHIKHPLQPLVKETSEFTSYVPSITDQSAYAPSVADIPPYVPSVVEPFYQHDHQVWGHFHHAGYPPEPLPLSPASIRGPTYSYDYAYRDTPDLPSSGESSLLSLDSAPLVFRDKNGKAKLHPSLFRSFGKLNHRVLCQMQSNIADLEHELAVLDARTILADGSARSRKTDSRRSTKDQSHRADLYQELHTSLEQYYEALSSHHKISQISRPCGETDAGILKSWLQTHVSPSTKVAPLVGDGSDIIRLGQPSDEISQETFKIIMYSILTNVFLPLLTFKFVSDILWRLILLTLTTTASVLVLDRHHSNTRIELGHLYWKCIIGCTSFSVLVALLF